MRTFPVFYMGVENIFEHGLHEEIDMALNLQGKKWHTDLSTTNVGTSRTHPGPPVTF